MNEAFDVAVVGSGFAGSLFALVARRAGRTVALLEKGAHPRFAIGESSSPLANLLLEEIAARFELPRLLPLTTWGTWRRTYPEITCGLKRGFTFYAHEEGRRFAGAPDRSDQLLVAASPNDAVADTHWYRPDFDQFLVREAEAEGAAYRDRSRLAAVSREGDGWRLEGDRLGEPFYRLEMPESGWMSGVRGAVLEAIGQVYFATATGIQMCEANGRV
ncbi:MAG TPA: FAD-dependent oxidoreductase, partial [Thermoanaerobaculia bacterium]|nr:FAD-dependent oxidoreductase [Thermoanaerobaculia bacterium]